METLYNNKLHMHYISGIMNSGLVESNTVLFPILSKLHGGLFFCFFFFFFKSRLFFFFHLIHKIHIIVLNYIHTFQISKQRSEPENTVLWINARKCTEQKYENQELKTPKMELTNERLCKGTTSNNIFKHWLLYYA